jgi:hypothetical protein
MYLKTGSTNKTQETNPCRTTTFKKSDIRPKCNIELSRKRIKKKIHLFSISVKKYKNTKWVKVLIII